jgi:isopentenyl diphosphate isomerase/L-lactate dehydrogenase-like FMN-dependent dehydrogenase
MQSAEAVIDTINTWEQGLRIALFASGCKNWLQIAQLEFTNQ